MIAVLEVVSLLCLIAGFGLAFGPAAALVVAGICGLWLASAAARRKVSF